MTRIRFRSRLVIALVLAVAVTALLVGAISVPVARSSVQGALLQSAIVDTHTALTIIGDDAGLRPTPTDAEITESGLVPRLEARGADGVWLEVAGQEPYLSSLAMLDGPAAVSATVRETIARGEIGWQFTSIAGTPVLITGAQRPSDGLSIFLVNSTTAVTDVTTQLRQTTLLVALAVALVGSLLAWAMANRLLRPVTLAGEAAVRMAAGELDTTLPTGPDQFGQLGAAFNTMAASLQSTISRLEQARDRERRFVADASHDLRTPVTGLVAAADMLEQRLRTADVDDDTRQLAAAVDREAANLRRLVEGLLEVSQLGRGQVPEDPSGVDLAGRLHALVNARLPDASVVIPTNEVIVIPAMAFERIVGNLLDNARVHAGGNQVQVTATMVPSSGETAPSSRTDSGDEGNDAAATRLEVEVADRGPGIPPEELELVFDRLTTGAAARDTGTGLGLAIARGQARLHGGDVTAHVRDGGGTVLRLVLPVAQLLHDGDPAAISPRHHGIIGR